MAIPADLPPVADDMSAFVIAGVVTCEQEDTEYETVSRTPAQGIDDGVEAERLGYRRCGCRSASTLTRRSGSAASHCQSAPG